MVACVHRAGLPPADRWPPLPSELDTIVMASCALPRTTLRHPAGTRWASPERGRADARLRGRGCQQGRRDQGLLLAPAILLLLGITLCPGAFAIHRSLFVVRSQGWTRAGLDNDWNVLCDAGFWATLWNTVLIGANSLAVQATIALRLACFACRDPFVRGWGIVFLVPMLVMSSAVACIWTLAVNDGRVISDLLTSLGPVDGNVDCLASVRLATSSAGTTTSASTS